MKKILVENYAVVLTEPVTVVQNPTTVFTDDNVDVVLFDTEEEYLFYLQTNNIENNQEGDQR